MLKYLLVRASAADAWPDISRESVSSAAIVTGPGKQDSAESEVGS